MRVTLLRDQKALRPGYIRLAAVVTGAGTPTDGVLWVDIPEACVLDISARLDAWLLWLLPHAFHAGEDLEIDGPVDAELLRNVHELMEVWSCWQKGKRPVRVVAGEVSGFESVGQRTGLFFTAGVDSFFSLLHHDEKARLNPQWRQASIDDLIYIKGYDIPLRHQSALDRKETELQKVADRTGKTLITLVTNFRDTAVSLQGKKWGPVVHGPAVVASGLLLGKRWHTLLLSASHTFAEFEPWGSTIFTDPLLSTSHTLIRHYGAGFDRMGKTEFLSRFDVALDHLHVCWKHGLENNCGVCEKCFRTLLAFDMANAGDRLKTFPKGAFSVDRLRDVWLDRPAVIRVYRKFQDYARSIGRADVVEVIDECLSRSSNTGGDLCLRWKEPL
jgi:hypothetical protein